jgi:hypothetical protein
MEKCGRSRIRVIRKKLFELVEKVRRILKEGGDLSVNL